MKIEERFGIAAAPDSVWAVLRDPEAVARCFPGAEFDQRSEDGTFLGRIKLRLGPTVASFAGKAIIEIDDETRSAVIDASGKDSRGSSRAKAKTTVRLLGEGGTSVVTLHGAIEVNGPLSSFAETGGVYVTRELLKDFAAEVEHQVLANETGTTVERPARGEIPIMAVLFRLLRDAAARLFGRLRRRKA